MDFFGLPIEQQIELARQVARRAVAEYGFPPDTELSLLKHRENSVFRVTHPATGARTVLRVHRTGYQTEGSIISEFQWMAALKDAGVQTPATIRSRTGALVCVIDVPELSEPRLCDMLEWIDGDQPRDDDLAQSFRRLGELHARCHAHAEGWRLPAGFERQAWDDVAFLDGRHSIVAPAWENWLLDDETRRLVLEMRAALREALRRWGKQPDRYGLIHGDLMPENLIVSPTGVRLIDFDDCGFGWYLYDAASALLMYYLHDTYADLVAAWAAGYRTVRALSDADLAELPTFMALRCFYGLGWLHTRRNSKAAQLYGDGVIAVTREIGTAFLNRCVPDSSGV